MKNKYLTWYINICQNAKRREKPLEYTEKHHIFPVSIFENNKVIIDVTAKEHYLLHYLLFEGLKLRYGINDNRTRKAMWALNAMNSMNNGYTKERIGMREFAHKRVDSICKSSFSFPDIQEKARINRTIAYQRSDVKKKMSDSHVKYLNQDGVRDELSKKMKEIFNTPEKKQMARERRQRQLDDVELTKKMNSTRLKTLSSDIERKKNSERLKEYYKKSGSVEKNKESQIQYWNSEDGKQKREEMSLRVSEKERKLMNNGIDTKQVDKIYHQEYLNNGWKFGDVERVWMNNGMQNKRINKISVDEHLKNNWYLGKSKDA